MSFLKPFKYKLYIIYTKVIIYLFIIIVVFKVSCVIFYITHDISIRYFTLTIVSTHFIQRCEYPFGGLTIELNCMLVVYKKNHFKVVYPTWT